MLLGTSVSKESPPSVNEKLQSTEKETSTLAGEQPPYVFSSRSDSSTQQSHNVNKPQQVEFGNRQLNLNTLSVSNEHSNAPTSQQIKSTQQNVVNSQLKLIHAEVKDSQKFMKERNDSSKPLNHEYQTLMSHSQQLHPSASMPMLSSGQRNIEPCFNLSQESSLPNHFPFYAPVRENWVQSGMISSYNSNDDPSTSRSIWTMNQQSVPPVSQPLNSTQPMWDKQYSQYQSPSLPADTNISFQSQSIYHRNNSPSFMYFPQRYEENSLDTLVKDLGIDQNDDCDMS